jgi:hypothetical protein
MYGHDIAEGHLGGCCFPFRTEKSVANKGRTLIYVDAALVGLKAGN